MCQGYRACPDLALPLFIMILATQSVYADPPGFRLVQVTNTPDDVEFQPQLNDHGDVVFSRRIGGYFNEKQEEVFLYSGGDLKRVTDDGVQDRIADINNSGTVVWSRFDGPEGKYGPTAEIVKWKDGVMDYLTDDNADDFGAKLNNLEHIVWSKSLSHNFRGAEGDACTGQM